MHRELRRLREAQGLVESSAYEKAANLCRKLLRSRTAEVRRKAIELLGIAELRGGDPEKAVVHFRQLSSELHGDPLVQYNLACAYFKAGNVVSAISSLRDVLRLAPEFVAAYSLLAQCHLKAADSSAALEVARMAVRYAGDNSLAWNDAGVVFEQLGYLDEAEAAYRRAVSLRPHQAVFLKNLGLVYLGQGRLEEAGGLFRKAVRFDPGQGQAWRMLVGTRRYDSCDDPDARRLRELLDRASDPDVRIDMLFALGKIFDDCGEVEQAFGFFEEGNRLECQRMPLDLAQYERRIAACRAFWLADKQPQVGVHRAVECPAPVFIVGLPRSGTTLVESRLSSQYAVFPAGELRWFHELEFRLSRDLKKSFPEFLSELRAEDRLSLSREYHQLLASLAGKRPWVADKLPGNFERLGLVFALFPNARVIHCVRDPMDVCASLYFNRFPGALAFSYSFERLAAYVRYHDEIMSLWYGLFGNRIHRVQYESLVEDEAGELKRLGEFLGAKSTSRPGEGEAHRNRWIRTGSEAHRPTYRSSIGKWRRYEKQFKPLLELLAVRA